MCIRDRSTWADVVYCKDYVPEKTAIELRHKVGKVETLYQRFSIFTMVCVVIAFMGEIVLLTKMDPDNAQAKLVTFVVCLPLFMSGLAWIWQQLLLSTYIRNSKALAGIMEKPCIRDEVFAAVIEEFSGRMRRVTTKYETPMLYMMVFGICIAVVTFMITLLAIFATTKNREGLAEEDLSLIHI
eukprot:TRINITY_DN14087_c0_g1_i3.p1 TRINITY_DN14087_c0_g1~~TRINITY_DN14087_c0_g1_i3.p1  ORF type:complete len:205 (-),score=20.13 TRINITY_DN14087_c0_g1_i3:61-612(-)